MPHQGGIRGCPGPGSHTLDCSSQIHPEYFYQLSSNVIHYPPHRLSTIGLKRPSAYFSISIHFSVYLLFKHWTRHFPHYCYVQVDISLLYWNLVVRGSSRLDDALFKWSLLICFTYTGCLRSALRVFTFLLNWTESPQMPKVTYL